MLVNVQSPIQWLRADKEEDDGGRKRTAKRSATRFSPQFMCKNGIDSGERLTTEDAYKIDVQVSLYSRKQRASVAYRVPDE